MEKTESKDVIRANCKTLVESRGKKWGPTGIREVMGVSHGAAQRIYEGRSQIQTDTLDEAALHVRLAPWQLIAPNMEAGEPFGYNKDLMLRAIAMAVAGAIARSVSGQIDPDMVAKVSLKQYEIMTEAFDHHPDGLLFDLEGGKQA